MPTYWDAYLEKIGNSILYMTIQDLLKGFYEYLEKEGRLTPDLLGKG